MREAWEGFPEEVTLETKRVGPGQSWGDRRDGEHGGPGLRTPEMSNEVGCWSLGSQATVADFRHQLYMWWSPAWRGLSCNSYCMSN